MKVCSKCFIEKDESEFCKHGKYLSSWCNKCKNSYDRQYRKTHVCVISEESKVKRRIYQRKYRINNPEKVKASDKIKYDKIKNDKNKLIKSRASKLKYYHNNKVLKDKNDYKKRPIIYEQAYVKIKHQLKKQIGENPPPELVELKVLIYKTKKLLCETSKS